MGDGRATQVSGATFGADVVWMPLGAIDHEPDQATGTVRAVERVVFHPGSMRRSPHGTPALHPLWLGRPVDAPSPAMSSRAASGASREDTR